MAVKVGDQVIFSVIRQRKRGTVVYAGASDPSSCPPFSDAWLSHEEYEAVQTMRGRLRFDAVDSGVIVRVDRTDRKTKDEVVPWYYAPGIVELV